MELQVGMRVMCESEVGNRNLRNQIGTIIYVLGDHVCIEFENDISGHDGIDHRFKGKDRHCWNVYKRRLKPLIATPDQAFDQYIRGHITEEAYREVVEKHGV